MSRSRTLDNHLRQLGELKSIIASMKTLAHLELHKLGILSPAQHAMADGLQQMADDFLHFYPQKTESDITNTLWLVLGSERGFCGDFNDALVRRLKEECPGCAEQPQRVLAVGAKLCGHLDEVMPGYVALSGASASEELQAVLLKLARATQEALELHGRGSLHVILHDGDNGEVVVQRLLPPASGHSRRWHHPPLLQLPPQDFFAQFMQHYLLLRLNELFTLSLWAENQYRVQHLEGAVRRLDERLNELSSRSSTLRQEEITEEIEMILLGTGSYTPTR